MDIAHILIIFLVGCAAGFIAVVSAGAGLITIPALIFLGLPANAAIATNALSVFGALASALPQYSKAKLIRWGTGIKLVPLAIAGGFIGSKALVRTDVDVLQIVVGILLLLLIPVVLLNSDKGIRHLKVSTGKMAFGALVFFAVMIYGGFFGAAGGIFARYTLIFFLGMTYLEASATNLFTASFLSVTALTVFITHGLVDWQLGLPLMVGMYAGGTWGAKNALEKGNSWVRIIFVVVAAAAATKLLFFR